MSSNRASTSKPDPRIAKREAMVTRHKSAQMKRQLRTKDRSMKHLTDLLKNPSKESQTAAKIVPAKKKQSSPKTKQSLLESVEKVQNLPQKTFKLSKVLRKEVLLIPDEEYYPNKLKRKLNVKKVILKPKNSLRIVGDISGSIKRKCGIPSKASSTTAPNPEPASPLPRLSMAEAMKIMEEHLTDEDMMEILTCPSPVWWEDPPDEDYVEDALFTKSSSDVQAASPAPAEQQRKVDADNIENDTDRMILMPNLSEKSDKFLNKRSKLEDLLGSIKHKSNNKSHNNENDAPNEDVEVMCSNARVNSNETNINEVANNNDSERSRARLSESDDEIVFHNSSMNEDELLKDLENMNIPIADRSLSNDVIVIDDDDDDFLDKPTNISVEVHGAPESKINDDETTVISDTGTEAVNEDINKIDTCPNEVEVAKNLADLQKCELRKEISSPKSFQTVSSKSSVVSSQDIDSISDTNVRFLLEDEVDDNSKNLQASTGEMALKSNEVNTSENTELRESDKEASDDSSVTVYKIIEEINNDVPNVKFPKNELPKQTTNIDEEGIKSTNAMKLNVYYKKFKKVYQKRAKKEEKTDINKNDVTEIDDIEYTTIFCDSCKPSFKRVSDEENVKYCLNCSSIFDSKDCTYCIRKPKNKTHNCISCKIKFCCEMFYETHKYNCDQNSSCKEISKLSQIHNNSDTNIQFTSYSIS